MIQIDDAGSGSLLGGTIIGVLRVESNEYQYEIIPLSYYQPKAFKEKKYLSYVVDIVSRIFLELKVPKEEQVQVCRGYMFEELNKWFKSNGYNYISTQINEPLQTIIERTFEDYAIELGLPRDFITYTKFPFHFHRILKWVFADFEARSVLCKTGWRSWMKYSSLQLYIGQEKVRHKDLTCLKCNGIIPCNTLASVIKFYSNRSHKVFLHNECLSVAAISQEQRYMLPLQK